MGRDPLIDAMAGNYRLVARLGAGGMGEVYKGVHDAIGSKVAIKLLHATAARDRSLQERFLLEAKAVNRIDHPGVVKIIDAGRMDSGRPFLVMELLEGSSLHDLRKAGKLSLVEACRSMVDVLDALAAAHAAGVVHRDLKPANLFRTKDGRTVVLDFGVAKLMASDAPVRLTMTGSAIGTPHYMAPEQIRGKPVTPAVDIYAAGVVLFELLCNRRPFDHTDDDGVMAAHLERRPPPPRALEPSIPLPVQDVILAALAKDPAKRPPSAAAMRDALRAALTDVPSSPAEPARSPWARPGAAAPPAIPDSMNVPTLPSPARRPIPRTEPSNTPAAVVAHRQRAARIRTIALLGAAAFAVFGVVLIVIAARRSNDEIAASAPSPSPPPARTDAALAVALDAALAMPVPAPDPSAAPTCAQLLGGNGLPAPAAKLRAAIMLSCEDGGWDADAIACFVGATKATELDICSTKLTATQLVKLRDAMDKLSPRTAATKPKPRDPKRSPDEDIDLQNPFDAHPKPPPDVSGTRLDPFAVPRQADVKIETTPPGAEIAIDDKVIGRTPWSGRVGVGNVVVTLRLHGYRDKALVLDVQSGRENVRKVTLSKTPVNNDTGLERPE